MTSPVNISQEGKAPIAAGIPPVEVCELLEPREPDPDEPEFDELVD